MSVEIDKETLEAHMYSAFPILRIESDEEARVLNQLQKSARRVGKDFHTWSIASGLNDQSDALHGSYYSPTLRLTDPGEPESDEEPTPEACLREITQSIKQSVVVLLDFHPYLESPKVIRLLKEVAFGAERAGNKIILLSHSVKVPNELAKLCEDYEVKLPSFEQIEELVDREASLYAIRNKQGKANVDDTAKSMLVNNLVGVNLSDAERLVRNAINIDGAIDDSDIPAVKKAKYRLLSKAGALTFEYDTASFDEIGGFNQLKRWVNVRQNAIVGGSEESGPGLHSGKDRPKGVLLLGVQGCGKSLAARAISGQLGIPLVRLDFSALYNKYIGESERNMREALQTAQVMSPCVLWIDEIEKGVSGQDDNTGASGRMLGYLLSWMQENSSGTFLVATANDISALPPELIRKGRIDEIFFVDLPGIRTRKAILESVMKKRGLDPQSIDLDSVTAACEGFSGAELEQAVVAALYRETDDDEALCATDIIAEMHRTRPLSVVRYEEIRQLREWAAARTVNVDDEDDDEGQDNDPERLSA